MQAEVGGKWGGIKIKEKSTHTEGKQRERASRIFKD